MKKAIVTGITGQDGAYLAEFLLQKGYTVYGTYRRLSSALFWRIEELKILNHPNLHLIELDIMDQSNTIKMIKDIKPNEIYNLAAQSFVRDSFEKPIESGHVSGIGCLHILEAIRTIDLKIKFYQASTSEMFGKAQETPQIESTPFYPRNPYGIAKLYAHWMTVNYRESYGIFGCSGILFNHESPLRGKEFVTRKITDSVAKIKLGMLDYFEIGNMDSRRDWGFAKDYVKGMYLMLQAKKADTYILATNRSETVRNFIIFAFREVGIELEFQGKDENEIAINKNNRKIVLKVNPKFYRPAEVNPLIGNPQKAKDELGWQTQCTLEDLCSIMVQEDLIKNKKFN